MQITRPEQRTPKQFKKFLSSGQNKEELIEFLFCEWKKCDAETLSDRKLFVCHKELCHSFHSVSNILVVEEVKELRSDHEEADTRLLLHAKHASKAYSTIIIKSPDTDVMLLSLSFAHEITNSIFFVTGTEKNARIVNVTRLSQSYWILRSQALLALHVFTGCDSVSAFRGKGKIKAVQIMFESEEFCETFNKLGRTFVLTFSVQLIADHFKMSCQHQVWQDMVSNYKLKTNSLLSGPAPEIVLKTVHCSCRKTSFSSKTCPCRNAELQCTDLCGCTDCSNNVDICEEVSIRNDDSDEGNSI